MESVLVEVIFGVPHLEEIVVLATSVRVVPVVTLPAAGLEWVHWLLDVPESVVWNSSEDLGFEGSAETLLVRIFQILDEIVLLVLVKDAKLLVENGVELFKFDWRPLTTELVNDGFAPGIFVLWI